MNLLDEFINQLPLLDHHRADLKSRRGFTDETIDRFKLKSCGNHVGSIVSRLRLSDIELRSQLFRDLKILVGQDINQQLLSDRILIPYLEADGTAFKIRPHHLGFSGDPVAVFAPFLLSSRQLDHTLIVTEGEFKAIAGWQLGLTMVAIPGVQSMSKAHFDEFLLFVSRFGFKSVCFLFDREIKDNPKFSNYKPDWKKRFDSEIYSYVMAKKTKDANLDAYVCEFPLSWLIDGKIDVDGALASGKTTDDFRQILQTKFNPDDYRKMIIDRQSESKIKSFLYRKCCAYARTFAARRDGFGGYEVARKRDEWKTVSNFNIEIEASYFDIDELVYVRPCRFVSNLGEKSQLFNIDPAEMTSRDRFRKLCASHGNFQFTGTEADLDKIWEYELTMADSSKKIVSLKHCGFVVHENLKDHDIWVFQNVAFVDDREILPDESGIFWISEELGFCISRIAADGHTVPVLNLEPGHTFESFMKKFEKLCGVKAKILFGWFVYSILAKYTSLEPAYPFPFAYGKSGGGKTTALRVLMSLFGTHKSTAYNYNDETAAGLRRKLAFMSMLPVWFDEFGSAGSNKFGTDTKEAFLKSAYNQNTLTRADRESDVALKTMNVRSTIVFSGETTPQSEGLGNRCISLHFPLIDDRDNSRDLVQWFIDNQDSLSCLLVRVLRDRKALSHKFNESCKSLGEYFSVFESDVQQRLKNHVTMVVAGYEAIFGKDEGLWSFVIQEFLPSENEAVKHDQVSEFFDSLMILLGQEVITEDHIKIENGNLAIWLGGCHDIVKKHFPQKELSSKKTIRKSLETMHGFDPELQRTRLQGTLKRVISFKIKNSGEDIQSFAQAVESKFNVYSKTRLTLIEGEKDYSF